MSSAWCVGTCWSFCRCRPCHPWTHANRHIKKNSTDKKETTVTQLATAQVDSDPYNATVEIRAFHANVPEDQLVELRRRVAATRWPDKETVSDATQGVQLATMQKLAQYWATDYDWRKVEAKLNAL